MARTNSTNNIITAHDLSRLDALSFTREHQIQNRPVHGHHIFLSPHYDDACFSLGDFLASIFSPSGLSASPNIGILLNIFTRTNYLAADRRRRLSSCKPGSEVETISDIRRTEDRLFAAKVNVSARHCGLDDAPLRGRDPFGAYDLTQDTETLGRPILSSILNCRKDDAQAGAIFCPMGIGRHVDHIITRDVILNHYTSLNTTFSICFYEDLYYASSHNARVDGILAFFQRIYPRRAARLASPVAAIRPKLDLIRIYESQFEALPLALDEFSPNIGAPSPTHEAVWVLTDE